MKLYFGPASPYVRKVVVTAIEAGLDNEIERVKPIDNVWIGNGDEEVSRNNPLGKMPTLISREGTTLIDPTLICEYLTSLAPEAALLPDLGPERWRVLQLQALAQGLMDATVNRLIEIQIRPEEYCWPGWAARQKTKVSRTLDHLETAARAGDLEGINLGTITLAVALGYLQERVGETAWRDDCPSLAAWFDVVNERPSMAATKQLRLPPKHLDPRHTQAR